MGGVHSHRHIGELRILKKKENIAFTDNSIGIENYIIEGSKKPKTLAGYGRISFDIYNDATTNADIGGWTPLLITCFYFRQSRTSTSSYTHYSFMNVANNHPDSIFKDLPKNLYIYKQGSFKWESI
jgi:hypothetical protein